MRADGGNHHPQLLLGAVQAATALICHRPRPRITKFWSEYITALNIRWFSVSFQGEAD